MERTSNLRVRLHGMMLAMIACLFTGCGDGVAERIPVSGKITCNGEELRRRSGFVVFKPDASKGNTSPYSAAGPVDRRGNFELHTQGKPGAPLGWYKVTVTLFELGYAEEDAPLMVNPEYANEAETPLSVEVVANPQKGAYDLKVQHK